MASIILEYSEIEENQLIEDINLIIQQNPSLEKIKKGHYSIGNRIIDLPFSIIKQQSNRNTTYSIIGEKFCEKAGVVIKPLYPLHQKEGIWKLEGSVQALKIINGETGLDYSLFREWHINNSPYAVEID